MIVRSWHWGNGDKYGESWAVITKLVFFIEIIAQELNFPLAIIWMIVSENLNKYKLCVLPCSLCKMISYAIQSYWIVLLTYSPDLGSPDFCFSDWKQYNHIKRLQIFSIFLTFKLLTPTNLKQYGKRILKFYLSIL